MINFAGGKKDVLEIICGDTKKTRMRGGGGEVLEDD
jgi:hypothetical protein